MMRANYAEELKVKSVGFPTLGTGVGESALKTLPKQFLA
jgi:O-acetyl-ADP-ribose deacetylase (regulator of RNase III)